MVGILNYILPDEVGEGEKKFDLLASADFLVVESWPRPLGIFKKETRATTRHVSRELEGELF
jgi:hypothetical protein